MPPSLSVIIPTYQRRDSVARLLRSLDTQTLPPDQFEVIVVIDGSEDGTRELLAGWKAAYPMRAIWQTNQQLAAARNTGIQAATTDLFLFLDDDMEAEPGLLTGHLAAHGGPEPVGVVGAVRMRIAAGAPPVANFWSRRFERLAPILSKPGYRIPPGEFYAGNFSVSRQTLLDIGLFDAKTFREYGAEDMELAQRLVRRGVPVLYSTEGLAIQHHTKGMRTLIRDRLAAGRSEVAMVGKHSELWAETQLSKYGEPSPGIRLARSILLTAGRVVPGFSEVLARVLAAFDRSSREWPEQWYVFVMNYYYWLGAHQAIRANRRAGRGLLQLDTPPEPGGPAQTGEPAP